jgi:hypothetical protein
LTPPGQSIFFNYLDEIFITLLMIRLYGGLLRIFDAEVQPIDAVRHGSVSLEKGLTKEGANRVPRPLT